MGSLNPDGKFALNPVIVVGVPVFLLSVILFELDGEDVAVGVGVGVSTARFGVSSQHPIANAETIAVTKIPLVLLFAMIKERIENPALLAVLSLHECPI